MAQRKRAPQRSALNKRQRFWLNVIARCGYVAKGVVYGIAGYVAVLYAFKLHRGAEGSSAALFTVHAQRDGKILLAILAVGLAAYAIWRIAQAIYDTDRRGSGLGGIAIRAGSAFVGLGYAGLTFSAVRLLLGGRGPSDDAQAQSWTATLLAQPYGRWLVAAVGAGFFIAGLWGVFNTLRPRFLHELDLKNMSSWIRKLAIRLGQAGRAALGLVNGVIGIFLLEAASRGDPREARGVTGAMRLLDHRFGRWVVGAIGVGLLAYALYLLLLIVYRRIAKR
jgi:hypothetical protein